MGKKSSGRLNDTAAIAAMPMEDQHSTHVSIRKIDNGFVTTRSSSGQHGFSSSETFTEQRPDQDGEIHGPDDSGDSMRRAAAYLKRTDAI